MPYKMSHAIKFILLTVFFISGKFAYSQYEKDTVYLKFEENSDDEPYYRGVKFETQKKGDIVFNLISNGSLIYSKGGKADTLSIDKLDSFHISTFKEVEQKVKEFRYKTYKKSPPNENDKAYQFYNKNDIFETFLIEIISSKKFVVYPVKWRNQNVID